jgi:hypothetical protein
MLLRILVGSVISAAVLIVAPAHAAAPLDPAAPFDLSVPCSSPERTQAVVDQRTAELGETGRSVWTVASIDDPRGLVGIIAGKDRVTISPAAPCGYLRGTVDHEWAHLLQDRLYPGHADQAYGGRDEVEAIADCVAAQLGNPHYRPYLAERGYGCTQHEAESARWLITTAALPGGVA